MNLVITLVVLTLGCGTRVIVNGAVNYAGIPYNVYGNAASMQQSYLRSPIQYGAHQQSPNSVPVRRGYYPAVQPRAYAPVHPRAYAPVQPRVYAPVHPRAYAPVQPRTYAPVHPRVYAPQPRTYAPVHPRAYAPVHPRVYAPQPTTYAPVHPRAYAPAQLTTYAPVSPRTYAPAQLKAYAPASAATRTYGQRSSWYPSNAKPRVAYYVPARQPISSAAAVRQPISNAAAVRQPISNAFLRQPIRNVPVQRPVSRTSTPRVQWYRNAQMSVPYPQGYAAAQRSGVPVRLVAYGRNHIPRASSRNTLSKKPIKAANQQKISSSPISRNTNIKRNNIALNKKPNAALPQMTQVARNYINGIVFPSKTVATGRTAIQPIKLSSDTTHPTGQRLSSFLKNVTNFRETLKGDTMKQGLIYYNDDVSNKTRHRPTNFAPPTRKLGSQGAPGGSRVSLSNEDKIRPEMASKAVVSQIGSERDTIKETGENIAGEKIAGENTPEEKIPRARIPGERTPGKKTPIEKTPGENIPRERIPGEITPGETTPGETTPGEKIPRERIPGERTPGKKTPIEETPREKIPREGIPGEITPGEKTPGERIPGEITPGKKTPIEKTPREKIPRPGEKTPGEKNDREKAPGDLSQTGQSNTTSSGGKVVSLGTNGESKMASHFDNPKVDLGLLKEKVLHSNNSQFLKRVLQVLKKYTKLMKSSMAEKNMTSLRPGASIKGNGSNISLAEAQKQNSSKKVSLTPEKVDAKLKSAQAKDPFTELNKNLIASSENKNDSQLEDNPLALANGFNSTSTAIKIFDLLNKASKLNTEKLIEKEGSHTNTTKGKSEAQKSNSDSNAKDENASKKGKIETKHNLGKPVFNLMELQNGLERGNTIN